MYKEDKTDKGILYLGWFILFMWLFLLAGKTYGDDNQISLEQSGNNLELEIEQVGFNNQVGMLDSNSYINNAPNLDIHIVQYNFTALTNKILFDEVSGSNNTFKLGQGVAWQSDGSYTYDGAEGGGHYMEIDLYGNDNYVEWHQTNQSGVTDGHDFNLHVAGSDNFIDGRQQSSGVKTANITLYNSDNSLTFRQKGANATHTANITLDGTYGTDVIFKQLGTSSYSYGISVDCYTVGGCSLNVTQD